MINTHFEGLNGLRAISAIAVVLSHTAIHIDYFGLDNTIFGLNKYGMPQGFSAAAYGVTIFFVLSGFLITYLLLNEQKYQPINIRNFYMRRVLRIFPLYYLVLIIGLCTYYCFGIRYDITTLIQCAFFAGNVPSDIGIKLPLLGQYWSLGAEEQFYLFFPFFIKYCKGNLKRDTLYLIITLFVIRVIAWIINEKTGYIFPTHFFGSSRFHTILIGALAAMLYVEKNEKFTIFVTQRNVQMGIWTILLICCYNKVNFIFNNEVVALGTACIIIAQITNRNKIINLENSYLNFLGKISFGIYLIHNLVIFYLSKLTGHLQPTFMRYIFVYVAVLLVSIAVATLTYYGFEKRFLRMKLRFSTTTSKD